MVIMPASEDKDSCTDVKTVDKGKGPSEHDFSKAPAHKLEPGGPRSPRAIKKDTKCDITY